MIDGNGLLFIGLMALKQWAPTLFYVTAVYYIYKQLKGKKNAK